MTDRGKLVFKMTFLQTLLFSLLSLFFFYSTPKRALSNIREFKKLRRQLQRKLHIKIELCVKLSLLRLFHVDHVVQNTRIALSLAWYERFSCKAKSERFTAASSRCRQNLKYENFTSSFGRLRQNIAPKSVPHV